MSVETLNLRQPSSRAGGVWDYISASRLNLWLRCPLSFRLRYVDGVRTPTTPALFLGQRVHDALEVHYRHRQLGIALSVEDVAKRVDNSWDEAIDAENIQFKNSHEETSLRQQAVRLTRAYLAHVSDDDPVPLLVETSLKFPLVDPTNGEDLGISLVGIIDLVQDQGVGPVICDFKTASKSSPPFEVTHEIQLSCYAYLFRNLSGRAESGLEIRSLVKTKTPKIEFHPFAPRREAHFRRLFAVIRAYLDDLDRRRFVYRPSFGCAMCDFRDSHCRAWEGQ